jgi:hypothetical protein
MHVDLPAGIKSLPKSGSNPIQPAEVLDRLRELVVSLQSNPKQYEPEPVES